MAARGGRTSGRSLRRNPTIVIGGGLLLLLVLSAVLAPVLAPANPTQTGFSTRVRPPAILGHAVWRSCSAATISGATS